MINRTIAAMTLTLGAVACGPSTPEPPADQPRHALLEGLEAPPLNRPLTSRPGRSEPPAQVVLQEGPAVVLVTLDGTPFSGQFSGSGFVTVRDSVIDFTTSDERQVRIQYRAPTQLTALSQGEGVGALRLVERSGPEGANRALALDQGGSLKMGEVWRSEAEPIRFDLGSRLALRQSRVEGSERGAVAVPLDVMEGGQAIARVPIGETVTVQTRSGVYEVYVRASHLSQDDEPAGQFGSGYVLNAWIFRIEG